MNGKTQGNLGQGKRIADLGLRLGAGQQGIAHLKRRRREDVPLFAIRIMQERDAGRAVGIILDFRYLGGNTPLVTLEINDAVALFVATTTMTNGNPSVTVATRLLRFLGSQ